MNSSAETVTLALVSALICSLVIFFEGRFKGSVFGAPLSLGSVLLFAVLLYGALVALAMLIPAFGSFLGLSGIAPLAFVGAFVTGAVTLLASELSRLVLRALKR